ncbi:hypothetical protein [Thiolinea disciformis]|uniref:hypothetical protein n=1 Tax=Thiolinea disciformis TaxID=125614 RepID=UPI00036A7E29|nr:hypothetical protein [Thiolinea disciformis]
MALESSVLLVEALSRTGLHALLAAYGLKLEWIELGQEIPGSYWGEAEAGMIGQTLYVRSDTPIHSALHEACHVICMDDARRSVLHTDAGGDYAEEDAVCYLQIILADQLPEFGRKRALIDMDRWGYTFRLGSAKRWFEEDAEDARQWLIQHSLLTETNQPIYRLRA